MTAPSSSARPRRLSPRRRLLFGAVAIVLAMTVGVVALAVTRGGGTAGGRTSAAQDVPGPVLLVPGYGGGTGGLEQLATRLRAAGRQATVVPLPGDGTGDLDAQATALDVAVRSALAAGAPSVDLVGYSAGGVVTRLWARNHDGAARARRIVTLGSPHHGTDLAAVAGLLAPGSCPPACQQLAPGSDLISGLNSGDETPDGPAWVSIWTSQDQVVTPPDTARLVGAHNVVVQRICPGRTVDHRQLPTDAVVDALVLRALAAAPFGTPTSADCSSLAGQGLSRSGVPAATTQVSPPPSPPTSFRVYRLFIPLRNDLSDRMTAKQRRWRDESTGKGSSISRAGSSGHGSSPCCWIERPGG